MDTLWCKLVALEGHREARSCGTIAIDEPHAIVLLSDQATLDPSTLLSELHFLFTRDHHIEGGLPQREKQVGGLPNRWSRLGTGRDSPTIGSFH